MWRIGMALSLAVGAAFAIDLLAQPPGGDRDRGDRTERRDGDRDRGDRGRFDRDRDDRDRFRRGRFRMPPNPVVVALDGDRNGELSEAEIKNASKALMSLDENGDKKLTRDELRPDFGRRRGPREFSPERFVERFMENDENDDGKLTKEEMPERMRDGFARVDSNGDGSIDKKELGELAERFADRVRGSRDRDGRGGRGDDDRGERDRPGDDDRENNDREDAQEDADDPVTSDDL